MAGKVEHVAWIKPNKLGSQGSQMLNNVDFGLLAFFDEDKKRKQVMNQIHMLLSISMNVVTPNSVNTCTMTLW